MKKTVATGLMTGLGALGAAAVTGSATAKAARDSSCYGDDYGISPVPSTTGRGGSYHGRTDSYGYCYCNSNG